MHKLVFFGTQDWAGRLLEHLLQEGSFEVALVVTQPDQKTGRKKVLTPSAVKQVALTHGVSVIQPVKLRSPELIEQLKKIHADFSLIIAYGRLLPEEIISLYPLGTINVHPSLLPKWRGPSPVQAAIASGDSVSGVSIMKIDEQMDHGPLLAQKEIPLAVLETFETFMEKVVQVSRPLLVETLKAYADGSMSPREQNHSQATICKLLTREDGHIDWTRSAVEIHRQIRAYHPWPGAWSELLIGQKPLRMKWITAQSSDMASVYAPGTLFRSDHRLLVATGSGTLEVTLLQPEGRAPMPAKAFLSGYAKELGDELKLRLV